MLTFIDNFIIILTRSSNLVQSHTYHHDITQVLLLMIFFLIRTFMFKHTREKDLSLFVQISGDNKPTSKADIHLYQLIPAFVISELKTAFQIGFMIYVPFLVLDMVVASILMAMGMMMLPPILISLPFKLMLFVLVDGWHLLVGNLVKSFN